MNLDIASTKFLQSTFLYFRRRFYRIIHKEDLRSVLSMIYYMDDKLSDFKNLNRYWEKLESYVTAVHLFQKLFITCFLQWISLI